MNLSEKIEEIQEKFENSFLGKVNYEMIKTIVSNLYLVCVDVACYIKEEKIVLKCVYKQGFKGEKQFQYVVLLPFEVKSKDVPVSKEIQHEYIHLMGKLNVGNKIDGKDFYLRFFEHNNLKTLFF